LSFSITSLITPLAIIYRRIIKKVDKSVNFRNFGYIPGRSVTQNIKDKLFGIPNLMKRVQVKDIINTLDIQSSDVVLDFGCGSGYFTVEMAKLAKKAYGIDINEYIKQIEIPNELMGRLEYVQTSGTQLPFQDSFFDVVLASEILPMIPDPSEFLAEIRRVLKHTGRLVIVNGAGHPAIKDAFEKRPWFFRWLQKKYPERMPESYEEYCSILQKSFGTAQKNFIEEKDIRNLLTQSNILLEAFTYSPGYLAGAYFSWSQFLLYLRTGKTLSQQSFFLKYYILRMFAAIDRRRYPGGLLCIARKKQGNEHSLLNS
jgi:ubiquinone/menaquinone biosynthesis C-methylase UbiE